MSVDIMDAYETNKHLKEQEKLRKQQEVIQRSV